MLECPRISWIYRRLMPCSSRWVAKLCRKVCGVACLLICAFFRAFRSIFAILVALYCPPPCPSNSQYSGLQVYADAKEEVEVGSCDTRRCDKCYRRRLFCLPMNLLPRHWLRRLSFLRHPLLRVHLF